MADTDEYSSWVGLIYVFNLIVGTGALTLPAVFAGAGWLLSTVLVMLLALVSYVTATFVIETVACANATLHWRRVETHKIDESEVPEDDDNTTEETAILSVNSRRLKRYYNLHSKVELGEMTRLYFSKPGQLLFYISLCIYLYGDLAIYTTAVSKTIVDLSCKFYNDTENYDVPCWDGAGMLKTDMYRIYVAIFILLVGPFTYFNIQKTKYLQVFTSSLRWSAFLIMIGWACAKLNVEGAQGHPGLFSWAGVPGLLGSSIYSFMCHHSIPGLIAPFSNKQHVIRQIGLDYLVICGFYLFLALTGSFAFANLEDLYTLNFIPTESDSSSVFIECMKYFLGAFPLFTLSTSFPIIAITLQNNLKSLFLDVDAIDRYNFFIRRLAFPTLAVVPPVLVALSTHNLKTLVAITGSYAGVLIQYVIPAFLVYFARKYCKTVIRNTSNKYESPFRHNLWFLFVLGWSVLCIIFVTVNLILNST